MTALRKPSDVSPGAFEEMQSLLPEAVSFRRSYVDEYWRVFEFRVDGELDGYDVGDKFELALVRMH